jgi:hypothetical protein
MVRALDYSIQRWSGGSDAIGDCTSLPDLDGTARRPSCALSALIKQLLERRDRPGLDELRELRVAEHRGVAGQDAEERLLVVGDNEDGASLLELAEVPAW